VLACNRGLYHDGWMASAPSFIPWDPNRDPNWDPDAQVWELYKIDEDFSQANDLARQHPDKLRALQDLWWAEASKYSVLPLDWRGTIRFNAEAMGRPSLVGKRTKAVYHEGMVALPGAACLPMLNKSFTITAEVDLPDDKAQGMIVTQGGSEGGYGLYMRDGKPTFVYNYLGKERPTLVGDKALPKGKAILVVDFAYDGGGMGKGGKLTLKANGATVAEGRLERSVPIQFAIFEGLDVGLDTGSAVDFTYSLPFAFTGKIHQVTVEIRPEAPQKAEAGAAGAKMARQ
jgi:arylsulfatase